MPTFEIPRVFFADLYIAVIGIADGVKAFPERLAVFKRNVEKINAFFFYRKTNRGKSFIGLNAVFYAFFVVYKFNGLQHERL